MTLGYTVGGVYRALAIGIALAVLAVLLVGVPVERPFALVAAVVLGLVLFSALGLVVGIYAETWDHTTFISNIVILPLVFVGGVFYTVEILPSPWEELSHFNPLFYLVNAVRFGFLGESDVSVWLSLGVTAAMAVPAYLWAQWLFTQRAKAEELERLERRVTRCRRCPRLVEWREQVAREKRAAFADEDYWGRPVPGFGDPDARVYVLGLAPAAHGGNRTGRVFTGDRSGDWLFASMHRTGFASQPESVRPGDGLELRDAFVAAAVRCAPPANKPLPSERDSCLPYAARELELIEPGRDRLPGRLRLGRRLPPPGRQAQAPLRPPGRARGRGWAGAAGLVPPEPAEHLHRQAHRGDDGRGLPARRNPRYPAALAGTLIQAESPRAPACGERGTHVGGANRGRWPSSAALLARARQLTP